MGNMTTADIRAALATGRAVLRIIKTDEAWYGRTIMAVACPPGVVRDWSVGVDARTEDGDDGGTYGEWAIRWHRLSSGVGARVEAFSDSWAAMAAVDGFWPAMGAAGNDPIALHDALTALGFVDLTPRVSPVRPPATSGSVGTPI